MLWIIVFQTTISIISTPENTGFRYFSLTKDFFYICTLNILQVVTQKPIKHTIFWKNSIRIFRCN